MEDLGLALTALGLGGCIGGGAVWLWARQQGKLMRAKLFKVDQARLQAQQFADQARKQIEMQQLDLNAMRQAAGASLARRTRPMESVMPAPSEPEEKAADGFQQTQMLSR